MWINVIKEAFGFFWIAELVDELEKYNKQRDKYPTLESYMPKLAKAYKVWAEKLGNNKKRRSAKQLVILKLKSFSF